MEEILEYRVMTPFSLRVAYSILDHPNGKAAAKLFLYLMSVTRMGRTKDGWASMSSVITEGTGLDRATRIRGLKALKQMNLIELKQSGHKAYWAKLLYRDNGFQSAKLSKAEEKTLEIEIQKILATDDTDEILVTGNTSSR
jgi:hypothetical protein